MLHYVNTQLCFRPMTLADIPDVMVIEKRAYTAPWSEYLYRSEVNNPSAFYTVVSNYNTIVGYAGMRLNSGQAHLMTMVVNPDYQGRGIGDALLQYKLNLVREKGAKSVILEVRQSNTGAQKLYQKYGFSKTGVSKHYYPDNGEAALTMELTF